MLAAEAFILRVPVFFLIGIDFFMRGLAYVLPFDFAENPQTDYVTWCLLMVRFM